MPVLQFLLKKKEMIDTQGLVFLGFSNSPRNGEGRS